MTGGLLGVVGVLTLTGFLIGVGVAVVRHGRYRRSGAVLAGGWALVALGTWGLVAAVVALVRGGA